jgi:hypothetical protein
MQLADASQGPEVAILRTAIIAAMAGGLVFPSISPLFVSKYLRISGA